MKIMDIAKCKICGNEITGRQKLYCSKECRMKSIHSKQMIRTCLHCGKEFVGSRYKNYCSKECVGYKLKSLESNKTCGKCIVCGKEFVGSKSKRYCSRSCQNKNATVRTCAICGKEFRGHYLQKSCSSECSSMIIENKSNEIVNVKVSNILSKYKDFKIVNILKMKNNTYFSLMCIKHNHTLTNTYEYFMENNFECFYCKVESYYENPNRCEYCNSKLDFYKQDNRFCNSECSNNNIKNMTDINKIEFSNKYGDYLSYLFKKGYTEFKVKEESGLSLSKIKSFVKDNSTLKYDLIHMEDTIKEIIINNDKLDFKEFGFTRTASCIFKDKYINMYNFLKMNKIRYEDKTFKCTKCGEYHNIKDFSTRLLLTKNSFFGVGVCKHCVKLDKDKRKRNSEHVDTYLDTEYILKIKNKFKNKCAICGDDSNIHIDHFIPLAWKINTPLKGNYILLCDKCNVSHKSYKNIFEWNSTYNVNYLKRINNIMSWLAKENGMSIVEYNNIYWDCYNSYIKNKNV